MIWLYSLASVVAVSLISLIGVFTLSSSEERLRRLAFVLVALSAGALFGDVFFHLMPAIYEKSSTSITASLFVLLGILISFILEKFLHWGHHHQTENRGRGTIRPFGYLNLISDGLHNFIDGITIVVSFLVSSPVGLATTFAVILHEIPQEIGDFGILIHAGFSRRRALTFNFFSALTALLGAIITLIFGVKSQILISLMLPVAAGNFLYIAGSNLVPELHQTVDLKKSLLQFTAFLAGIALMYALLFVE